MNKYKNERGFLLLELVVATGILVVILGMSFSVLKLVLKLQTSGTATVNLRQNQTLVTQRISQQVAIYSRSAVIQSGTDDRLVLNDIAGNRIVSFYKQQDSSGTAILYMSTQVPPSNAGVNQLTDPYNVNVSSFKVYKINSRQMQIVLSMCEKNTGRCLDFVELVTMLNGQIL